MTIEDKLSQLATYAATHFRKSVDPKVTIIVRPAKGRGDCSIICTDDEPDEIIAEVRKRFGLQAGTKQPNVWAPAVDFQVLKSLAEKYLGLTRTCDRWKLPGGTLEWTCEQCKRPVNEWCWGCLLPFSICRLIALHGYAVEIDDKGSPYLVSVPKIATLAPGAVTAARSPA